MKTVFAGVKKKKITDWVNELEDNQLVDRLDEIMK